MWCMVDKRQEEGGQESKKLKYWGTVYWQNKSVLNFGQRIHPQPTPLVV